MIVREVYGTFDPLGTHSRRRAVFVLLPAAASLLCALALVVVLTPRGEPTALAHVEGAVRGVLSNMHVKQGRASGSRLVNEAKTRNIMRSAGHVGKRGHVASDVASVLTRRNPRPAPRGHVQSVIANIMDGKAGARRAADATLMKVKVPPLHTVPQQAIRVPPLAPQPKHLTPPKATSHEDRQNSGERTNVGGHHKAVKSHNSAKPQKAAKPHVSAKSQKAAKAHKVASKPNHAGSGPNKAPSKPAAQKSAKSAVVSHGKASSHKSAAKESSKAAQKPNGKQVAKVVGKHKSGPNPGRKSTVGDVKTHHKKTRRHRLPKPHVRRTVAEQGVLPDAAVDVKTGACIGGDCRPPVIKHGSYVRPPKIDVFKDRFVPIGEAMQD